VIFGCGALDGCVAVCKFATTSTTNESEGAAKSQLDRELLVTWGCTVGGVGYGDEMVPQRLLSILVMLAICASSVTTRGVGLASTVESESISKLCESLGQNTAEDVTTDQSSDAACLSDVWVSHPIGFVVIDQAGQWSVRRLSLGHFCRGPPCF